MIPFRMCAAALAAVAMGGVLSSCSLNPKEDPTRYYVLTNIAEDSDLLESVGLTADQVSSLDPLDIRVGVRPVSFPSYLNRNRMVTRLTGNELVFMETERWGEPLEEAFHYALGVNLGVLLGSDEVILHPWYSTEQPEYVVMIDVVRFERDAGGAAHLVARWELRDSAGELLHTEGFETTEPGDPASISSSVQAQSRSVAALSRQISDAIRRVGS